ncbi:MAG: CDP-alcohol phosphatidyltransferase family protein [Myxococcota bacterium]
MGDMPEIATHSEVLRALFPLLLTFGFFLSLLAVYFLRGTHRRIPEAMMGGRRGESQVVARWAVDYWFWVIGPVERLFVRYKLSANYVTVASVVVSLIAGIFLYLGEFGWGGWLIFFGGTLDILDGRVARATGQSSQAGAFFDSTMDRFADWFVLSGLIGYYRHSALILLPLLALGGSLLTSYVRARGEGLGISYRQGMMQRAERLVTLGLGCSLSPLLVVFLEPGVLHPLHHLTLVALAVLAVLTNYTTLHRIRAIYRDLVLKENKESASPPAPPQKPEPADPVIAFATAE